MILFSTSLIGIYIRLVTNLKAVIFAFCHLVFMVPCIVFHFPVQTYFLPVIGLVDPENLSPGDLVVGPCVIMVGEEESNAGAFTVLPHFSLQGVNKDSYLILDKLPAE